MAQGSRWRSTKITRLHRPPNLAWLEVVSNLSCLARGRQVRGSLAFNEDGSVKWPICSDVLTLCPLTAERGQTTVINWNHKLKIKMLNSEIVLLL